MGAAGTERVVIAYDDETEALDAGLEDLVRRVAGEALDAEGLGAAVVEITFTGDAAIRALNRRHRGRDAVTDVLSFPLWTAEELRRWRRGEALAGAPPGQPLVLGDVVVNVREARRAAERYGHSFERELGFLVVHGILHLAGYDHATPEEEAAMLARTEAVLAPLGLRRPETRDGEGGP